MAHPDQRGVMNDDSATSASAETTSRNNPMAAIAAQPGELPERSSMRSPLSQSQSGITQINEESGEDEAKEDVQTRTATASSGTPDPGIGPAPGPAVNVVSRPPSVSSPRPSAPPPSRSRTQTLSLESPPQPLFSLSSQQQQQQQRQQQPATRNSCNSRSGNVSPAGPPSASISGSRPNASRSVSENIRAEREDLREAAEHTRNVIVDLGLDGRVKWVSPSWTRIIGSLTKEIEGYDVKNIIVGDKEVFDRAVEDLRKDDSRSRMIRFMVKLGPLSIYWRDESLEEEEDEDESRGDNEDETAKDPQIATETADEGKENQGDSEQEDADNVLMLEGQGIMVYDRFTGQESHTMWMLRPPVRPREITIDLPSILVSSLGVGAEVLANYLNMLAEAGGRDPAHHPPPMPVLCRICERQITPWWFEKHSELCITEHKAEMEVQLAHESLSEHRRAIVKVLDALEARGMSIGDVHRPSTKGAGSISGSGSSGMVAGSGGDTTPHPSGSNAGSVGSAVHFHAALAEYKGLPIGPLPSPASSEPNSASATPSQSRDPSRSRSRRPTLRAQSSSRSSFAPRRPLTRIVELILDLCDTALEINVPTLKEQWLEPGDELHFRTDSPQSDSRIAQVLQWQSPSSNFLEQEAGLAELAFDTEQVARAKVDAVRRHRRIIEYSERIRVEFAVLIEQCINAAIEKAEKIAAGELSDSSEASSETGDRANEEGKEYGESTDSEAEEREWREQWRERANEGEESRDSGEGSEYGNIGEPAYGESSTDTAVGVGMPDDQVSVIDRPQSRQSRASQISSASRPISQSRLGRPSSSASSSLPPPPTSVPASISGRSPSTSISKTSIPAPYVSAPQPRAHPNFSVDQLTADTPYNSDRERRPPSSLSYGRSPSPFECPTPRSQPATGALGMSNAQLRLSRRSLLNDSDASPGTSPADHSTGALRPASVRDIALTGTHPSNASIVSGSGHSSGQNSQRNSGIVNTMGDHSSALSSAIAAARLNQSPNPSEASGGHPSLTNRETGNPSLSLSRQTSSRDRREKRQSIKLPGLASSASPRRESPGGHNPASPMRLSRPGQPYGESFPSPTNSPLLPNLDAISASQSVRNSNSLERGGGESQAGSQPHAHSLSSHNHHRRQSSSVASPDLSRSVPLSPRLAVSNYPPQKAVAPSIKDFEIIKPISKGAFGSVYLSRKKSTGEYFAIKVLKKADMIAKNQITNVKAERAIMMWQGESDFVAKLYWTFSSKEYLYLVMEYLNGGDCASLVKTLGGLPEDWAKKYIAEVVLGVEHLHDRGIVHRDLKPDNLLIDQKGHLKLTDFGLSRMGLVGRQKRVIKSGNESAPDLLRSGPFDKPAASSPSSRSASLDLQVTRSPQPMPVQEGTSLPAPSYFSLNRETPPMNIERPRRSSGHRSDSVGSDASSFLFRNSVSVSDVEGSLPFQIPTHSQTGVEDDMRSEISDSPSVFPLHRTTSHSSSAAGGQYGTPPQGSLIPPPIALFDAADQGRGFVGTPDYLAPETIKGSGQDEMCDWWSLGCILFEFLYGYPPFNADTPDEVFDNILNRRIHWLEDEDEDGEELVSPEAKDLMNRLMTSDPRERLGSNKDGLYKNGGEEIRSHFWFADINWTTLLEDKAQFTPAPENPEDTEYFDARGATLQSFAEELEDSGSPPLSSSDYQDRPHDALTKIKSAQGTNKRTLLPLSIPPHVRDSHNRRFSEVAVADDFGNFTFKNLPVLEKANKDVIQKLKQEALQTQQRQYSAANTPPSTAPSDQGSPLLPGSLKRRISKNKRSTSPSAHSQAASASPSRPSQPSSPMYVQFSTGNHERRKTSGSQASFSGAPIAGLPNHPELPRLSAAGSPSPAKIPSTCTPSTSPDKVVHDPFKRQGSTSTTRSRSHTLNSQESEAPSIKEPFVRGHHKRRSQLFDVSPSSSDNEDPRVKALLKVQRRRQSSRRLSQLNLDQGPFFRPLDVLICEDHPVSRIVMERLFEKLRCRTITAVNGSEAMRYALSEVQFDAILTEFKLPYINGYDVARMIRETKSVNTRTPIVAVTGYLKEFPETHDFDALIEKPPTLTKLSETLSRLCQWKPPPKDMDLLPAPLQSPALRHAVLQGEDPPSSASSSYPYGPCPSAFSRQDSVGSRSSYSYFTDLEPAKPENASGGGNEPTRRQADELSTASSTSGLGHPQHPLPAQTPDRLSTPSSGVRAPPSISRPSALHAPRIPGSSTSAAANGGTLHKKPSISDLHSPRNLRKTLLLENTGAESGDDEDEELGDISGKASANDKEARRPQRPGSKLGQMMRTNSQGSVVSSSDGPEHAESVRPQEDNPSTGPIDSEGAKGLETSLEKLSIKDEKLTTLHEHEEQEDNMHSGQPNDRPEASSATSARDKEDDPAKDAQSTPTPSLQVSGPVSPTREKDNHSHSSASSVKSAAAVSTPPHAASRGPASQSSGGIIDKDKTPKASPMFTPPHDLPSDNDAQSDAEVEQTPKLSSMGTTSESRSSSNSQA